MNQPARLAGEVAIVTGSTSGLGCEMARLFAEHGASVIITGRSHDVGTALATQIGAATNADVAFIAADLTDPADRSALIEQTVARFGKLTVLVNNAVSPTAIAADGAVTDIDAALWHDMLSIALIAAAELCRLAIPHMIAAGGGSIVNVSAKSATLARPALTAYSSAKAALHSLTRSIAVDYSRRGVRCNTLVPGYIQHDTRDAGMTSARRAELEGMQLTRLATARDIAYGALFLASHESEVITGIALPADGGSTAARGKVI